MERVMNYIIDNEASIIMTEYDKHGNELSIVFDKDKPMMIETRPFELLNDSIKAYGYDIFGAFRGSRSILGNIKMPPINVNPRKVMIWFPCSSPKDRECVWLAHAHIVKRERLGRKKTRIYFKYGHTLTLDISTYSFDQKMKKAAELHVYLIKEEVGEYMGNYYGFDIVKETGNRNYRIDNRSSDLFEDF
ncbi:competence protein ComK [Peribacillus sp. SCS-155]|uniref:competence protein ComK n=1 Tax=Peribacillus sedimenti TaxID=3115297 RepID=UPI003905E793